MADSRNQSFEIMSQIQKVVDIQQKVIYFLLSIIIAFGTTYWLYEPSLNMAQIYVLFLLFLAVCLWVTEAIPPFAVGLLVFGFLALAMNHYYSELDPENAKSYYEDYVNTWSNSVIWLMLGGFFIADAMQKTQLDKIVFKLSISRFGTSAPHILLGLMLSTAAFSMIMSNTATTAMMMASVLPFLGTLPEGAGLKKAVPIGIAAAASVGGMGTLIGSPPNAIAVEALVNHGITFGFLEWIMVGFPIAVGLTLLLWFFLKKRYLKDTSRLKIDLNSQALQVTQTEDPKIQRLKKRIVIFVLLITLSLWLTERIHHIPASVVSLLPIMLLTMLGVLKGSDVRKLPWDTLMLVAGGLALGMAIKETGLAQHYVDKLNNFHINFYAMVFFFSFLTVILSNVMSNTATATILIPIAIILTYEDPIILPIVIGLSASTALFLPISTPPNAIAYSSGFLEQKDFRFVGLIAGILGPIIICLFTMFIFTFIY